MSQRGLKFGIFLAPFHPVGDNPILGIRRTRTDHRGGGRTHQVREARL